MNLNIIKKIIIAFVIMFLVSFPAMAESGSITISNDYSASDYEPVSAGSVGAGINYTVIHFYNNSYTHIGNFHVYVDPVTNPLFAYPFRSTTFTIVSGGSGTGVFWYDRNSSYFSYAFDSNSVFTSGTIVLSFAENIYTDLTITNYYATISSSISSVKPVCVGASSGISYCSGYPSYHKIRDLKVSSRGIDYYNVDYSNVGGDIYFSLDITKNTALSSKYYINGLNSLYSRETTFNAINITNAFFKYFDGIILNVTLSNGVYVRTYINSSGAAASGTTGTVNFNKSSYTLLQNFNFNWAITNFNSNFGYYATMYDSDNKIITSYVINSASGTRVIENALLIDVTRFGVYTIKLIEIDDTISPVVVNELDYSQMYYGSSQTDANVTVSGNITINTPAVTQGQKLNLSYNISTDGWIELYDGIGGYIKSYITTANNQYIDITLPTNYRLGVRSVRLWYYDIYLEENVMLDWDSYTVLSSSAFTLTSEKENYLQNELIKFYPYSNVAGYSNMLSPSGIVINNISITASGGHVLAYQTDINSEIGIYTAYLYNSTGSILISDTIYLNYGMQTAIPTVAGTATSTPVTLIDISSELSEGILGKLDANSDGLNSNEELSGFGNKILSSLVLIVIVLLISGIFSRKR